MNHLRSHLCSALGSMALLCAAILFIPACAPSKSESAGDGNKTPASEKVSSGQRLAGEPSEETNKEPQPDSLTSQPDQKGDAVRLATELEQIEKWGGQVEFDAAGRLVAVNLLAASLTDSDVKLLAKLPHLLRLRLKGSGITDAATPIIAGITSLTELDLDTVGITDDGVKTLTALSNLQSLRLHRASRVLHRRWAQGL